MKMSFFPAALFFQCFLAFPVHSGRIDITERIYFITEDLIIIWKNIE